jgi:hypothetical protein
VIVARGFRPKFVLSTGRVIVTRESVALLHDERGEDLPRDVVLVMPFRKLGRPLANPPPEASKQIGNGHVPLEGRVRLPSIDVGWREVGQVKEVYYRRRGEHQGLFRHEFGQRLFWRGPLPVLYENARCCDGGALKLVLARGGTWTWRGAIG